jgi:hypothetical protein
MKKSHDKLKKFFIYAYSTMFKTFCQSLISEHERHEKESNKWMNKLFSSKFQYASNESRKYAQQCKSLLEQMEKNPDKLPQGYEILVESVCSYGTSVFYAGAR